MKTVSSAIFKFKPLAAAVLSVALLSGCATGMQNNPNESMGTILGAVGGALLGSQVGNGKGQLMGVAVGTLAGAWIGGSIGRNMDEVDRMKAQRTAQRALEYNRSGTTSRWTNPDNGHQGTATPVRTYKSENHQACREYRTTITIDGRTEEGVGTACREPGGNWRLIG